MDNLPPSYSFFEMNSSHVSFFERKRLPRVGCLILPMVFFCFWLKILPVSSFLMKVSNSYLR